jgi:MFS family permease
MSATTLDLSTQAPPHTASARVVAATVAGNAIEFYDFLCFGFFAVYIAGAFFPTGDDLTNLLKTLAIFWSGFLFRPLGGVVLGAFADRAGRRPALMLTIALITVGTLGLAAIPSYATIGIAAPVLLVACRIVQGFALGGEVGPASVFLAEAAPKGARGFYVSWQIASQGLAVMAGGILGTLLSYLLTKQQLSDWGWRVPFLICLALIPIAFYLRSDMPETLDIHRKPAREPDDNLLGSIGYIALGVLLIIGGTVSTYVGTYMSTYAINTLKLPATLSLSATLVSGASTFVFALVGGWLGDRYGRKLVVLVPRIALAVLIWPVFLWLSAAPSPVTLWLATIVVSGLTAFSAGISLVIVPELLPKRIRATGLALSYAIGVTLFGGSTQFLITWLIDFTKNPVAPAFYVIITSLVTIGAMLALPETRGREID